MSIPNNAEEFLKLKIQGYNLECLIHKEYGNSDIFNVKVDNWIMANQEWLWDNDLIHIETYKFEKISFYIDDMYWYFVRSENEFYKFKSFLESKKCSNQKITNV